MTFPVLLRSKFRSTDSSRILEILRNVADYFAETRKGRHWDCEVHGFGVSLDLQSTKKDEYKDLLRQHNLSVEDAPEVIVITAGFRDIRLREWCNELASRVASEFDGISCKSRF